MMTRRGSLILVAVAVAVVSLGVVGCGGSSGAHKVHIAFVVPTASNPYWADIAKGAKSAAASAKNVVVSIKETTHDTIPEELVTAVEDALALNPDALAVVPYFPAEVKILLERAISDGIPVITIDSPVPGLHATSFVGSNNVEGGKVAGRYVADHLSAGDTVGILHCFPGVSTTDQRVEGFKAALEGTGIKVVATLDAKCDLEKGRATTEDLLTAHPDVDAIFSVTDTQTLGALQAVDPVHRPLMVSFDAQPEAVQKIVEGKLDGTVAQFPVKMGEEGIKAAIAAATGKKVEPIIDTGVEFVTKENASKFLK